MKKWCVILILFMLVPVVHAGVTFDSFKYNRDTWTVEEDIFTVISYDDFDSVKLRVNGENNYLLELEDCVQEGLDEYCFISVDWDKRIINDRDEISPAIYLKFTKLEPQISITRSILPTIMELDEDAIVTIKIENKGNKEATFLDYKELITDNWKLVAVYGNAIHGGDRVLWNFGRLTPGNYKEFSYKIKPLKYQDAQNTAFIKFEYEGVKQNVTSAVINYKVKSPYALSTSISNTVPDTFEPTDYTIILKNNEFDLDMDAFLYLVVPLDLEVISHSTQLNKLTNHIYTYEGIIDPEDEIKFNLKVRGQFTGEYIINATARMQISNKYLYDWEETKFKIETDKINPTIFLNVDNIRSGEPFETTLVIFNKDSDKSYKNIEMSFYSDLFWEDLSLDSLTPRAEHQFKGKYFTKLVDVQTNVPIIVNGTFESLTGEKFTFTTQRTLSVSPINQSIDLVPGPGVKELEKGMELNFEVNVKNLKDDTVFNIQVDDYFPESLGLVHGKPTINIQSIPGGQTVNAYTYRLKIPYNYPDNELTIVSRFRVFINGQEYTKSYETIVKLLNSTVEFGENGDSIDSDIGNQDSVNQNPIKSVNSTAPVNSTNPTGPTGSVDPVESIDIEKEPSFFSNLWNGLKDLINSIF